MERYHILSLKWRNSGTREVKQCVQAHTAYKRKSWTWNRAHLALESTKPQLVASASALDQSGILCYP